MPQRQDAAVFVNRYACLSSGAGYAFWELPVRYPLVAIVLSREWVIGLLGRALPRAQCGLSHGGGFIGRFAVRHGGFRRGAFAVVEDTRATMRTVFYNGNRNVC